LDFDKVRDKSPFELSGGQKRRVAIAGVIVSRPEVLVLDEPAAGLDPVGKRDFLELLHKIHSTFAKTIIIVSHDMNVISEHCTSAGIFSHGKVKVLGTPKQIFADTDASRSLTEKLHAACELYMTTSDAAYREFILAHADIITADIERYGWFICKALDAIADDAFTARIGEALMTYKADLDQRSAETPYGVPYRPHIWGAGWNIQALGFRYYYLYRAFPQMFAPELIYNALNFVLGCHPGSNTSSFASGVGTRSATTAYGLNRADWSYIPGGCVSGTGLIRPDFPELLEFPFLWQQTEYVLGGGSSHYMFLVLAAQKILGEQA
jgi:hypothetical protein